jgi:DNA-binding response OmpR family regulator
MNLLLIEDNPKLSKNIATVLKSQQYLIDTALTGKDGLYKALANNYDLIILDLALPDMDGTDVCKEIREKGKKTPILMLTARIDLESKVTGLDLGADDYLTKPFLMEELLARIRALLRRSGDTKHNLVQINEFEIDLTLKEVRINPQRSKDKKNLKPITYYLKLSPYEFHILEYLILNRGQPKNASEIYESVWGSDNFDILFSDTLKVHIAGLRKKMGKDLIRTIQGVGYIID